MKQYLDLVKQIVEHGEVRSDRTGVGAKSIFGYQMRFDLNEGFPAVTTKKLAFRAVVAELLWFLRGETNVKWLQEQGCAIWDEWADEKSELGPVYGKQWRSWTHMVRRSVNADDGCSSCGSEHSNQPIDQIAQVIDSLKSNPMSRRHIVSAWNVGDLDQMALPPCHLMFQFYVSNNKLSCQVYQRSADVFLGVPFNIASYALLTHMIAHVCEMGVGELVWVGGDCHLYLNHEAQVQELLKREPRTLPKLGLNLMVGSIDEFSVDDFSLHDYAPHPAIKAPVAV